MDQSKWADELVSYMQSSFETTMDVMGKLQDRGEKILNVVMDQGVVAQQEGKKVLNEWMSMAQKGREEYSKMMRENIDKFSDSFEASYAAVKSKSK